MFTPEQNASHARLVRILLNTSTGSIIAFIVAIFLALGVLVLCSSSRHMYSRGWPWRRRRRQAAPLSTTLGLLEAPPAVEDEAKSKAHSLLDLPPTAGGDPLPLPTRALTVASPSSYSTPAASDDGPSTVSTMGSGARSNAYRTSGTP
ncbi:Helicase C-terminal domain-containing protein [Mycena chlorophos]|uniref:Helicase C-terminal domain-containing protein n=1 Tax=Mycena chlorophos TaxID=658473 RepID=A0A8H6SQ47_MYCCL|nr:Helicase C-terminal domain-containing protein [Mycena chlorophos]